MNSVSTRRIPNRRFGLRLIAAEMRPRTAAGAIGTSSGKPSS